MTTAEGLVATPATSEKTREGIRTWTLVALIMFLISLVLWVGFMTVGGIFFTLSDAIALFMAASMIPVMIGFDALFRPGAGGISRTAKWIGVAGMCVAGAGSIVLLSAEVTHEFVPAGGGLGMQFVGFGLEGAWFLMIGLVAARTGLFSKRFSTLAYVTGVGFVLGVLGSPLGPDHPIVAIGGLLSFVGFVWWVIRTRRELALS